MLIDAIGRINSRCVLCQWSANKHDLTRKEKYNVIKQKNQQQIESASILRLEGKTSVAQNLADPPSKYVVGFHSPPFLQYTY